ncbi:hypothetical protein QJS04_geneDACA004098 [Acorus gramineus]|uniref:Uncharacterized protein n=1 Tax=Acorus gramineus TaxID=55184 RepID=A0AAV9BFQ7_ACOGR|nr:hypothetical protein QJS04_geneDACA004098 [Acorus gramineus]
MARLLRQTLIGVSAHPFDRSFSPSYRLTNVRNRSKRPEIHIEIDLGSEGANAAGGGGVGEGGVVMGIKQLEEAIYRIAAHKAAPDWLMFRPGSSYWVPPPKRRSMGMVDLIGKLRNPLSEEETMSFTSVRGWPSAAYFIEGGFLPTPKDEEEG